MVFEDEFSRLQTEMISAAYDYADGEIDEIYVYASYEISVAQFDVFYRCNGQITHKHKLNDVSGNHEYDVSVGNQDRLLDAGMDCLRAAKKLFTEHDREMPTEIKLYYNAATKKFNAKYSYELHYVNLPDKMADDIFDEWYEEVSKAPIGQTF